MTIQRVGPGRSSRPILMVGWYEHVRTLPILARVLDIPVLTAQPVSVPAGLSADHRWVHLGDNTLGQTMRVSQSAK